MREVTILTHRTTIRCHGNMVFCQVHLPIQIIVQIAPNEGVGMGGGRGNKSSLAS